ncbi:MAG: DUF177 domain-containing protein [Clostridiales bacterium]|nr:DUF177 domain-containing protein [Clostridiales bacterium]
MKIYIDKLTADGEKKVEIQREVQIPKSYSEFTAVPVRLSGKLKESAPEIYSFEGKVSADLRLKCDSCLTEFSKTIEFSVFEIFKKGTDNDEERYTYSNRVIDFEPFVYTELLLNFPMKNLCRDDCKGLCIKCGHNLNEGDCGCDRFIGNPEFEKLKSLNLQ